MAGMPFVVELKSAALVLLLKYDGAAAGQLAKFAAMGPVRPGARRANEG